ncbi:hypothetical protein OY671_008531, partial [Metschnikowia pulcherrima]
RHTGGCPAPGWLARAGAALRRGHQRCRAASWPAADSAATRQGSDRVVSAGAGQAPVPVAQAGHGHRRGRCAGRPDAKPQCPGRPPPVGGVPQDAATGAAGGGQRGVHRCERHAPSQGRANGVLAQPAGCRATGQRAGRQDRRGAGRRLGAVAHRCARHRLAPAAHLPTKLWLRCAAIRREPGTQQRASSGVRGDAAFRHSDHRHANPRCPPGHARVLGACRGARPAQPVRQRALHLDALAGAAHGASQGRPARGLFHQHGGRLHRRPGP